MDLKTYNENTCILKEIVHLQLLYLFDFEPRMGYPFWTHSPISLDTFFLLKKNYVLSSIHT